MPKKEKRKRFSNILTLIKFLGGFSIKKEKMKKRKRQ